MKAIYFLYCWTNVGWNVSKDFILRKLVSLSFYDHILHAAMVSWLIGSKRVSKSTRSDVTSEEERIIGVSGADTRNTNSRLCKDFVHWQGDNVLGFASMDLMPLTITELMLIIGSKRGYDGSSTIVDLKN